MKEFIDHYIQLDLGNILFEQQLSKYTTYRVGGKADCIVFPKDIDALVKTCKLIKKYHLSSKVLGNGSNTLFSDKPYHGVIIKLDFLSDVKFYENKVRVGAGFSLVRLASLAAKRSLTGLEFASGIPGTIGGATFMNAGAYNSDMKSVIKTVQVLTPDLKIITLENKEMAFHYRTSFLQKHPDYVCLEVIIKLEKGDKNKIEEVIRERRKRRVEAQPLEYPSAGSVFRNPEGMFAGEMIEKLGFKGKKQGGAMVSVKHANFIINYNNASSNDIKKLIEEVHDKVLEEYHVDMKIEQEFVNWE